jgi:phosphoglycolate phosphatase-like HAD superfamily hydrolase
VLRGVIFDIDGTLVDSNDAHARSWVDTLREIGYDVPFDVIWPMIGMGGDKLLPSAIGIESESAIGKQLSALRWEIFERDYLPRLKPARGARDLVQRMKDDGLEMIVASSAAGNELVALMEAANVKLVGLLCGGWTMLELSGATAIYDDPSDLLRWYDYSPFAVKAFAGKGSR